MNKLLCGCYYFRISLILPSLQSNDPYQKNTVVSKHYMKHSVQIYQFYNINFVTHNICIIPTNDFVDITKCIYMKKICV